MAFQTSEVDRRANEEERRVQIQVLVLQHLVVRDDVGVRPDIQVAHAEQTIGRNSSVITGRTREAAPIGRRMTTPQAPPES